MAQDDDIVINQQQAVAKKEKCDCKPGLPAWMATFADMVTLLLTFFVLLLSFAKTETSKLQAALGSIRNAFGGASLQQGEVIIPGKSPDNKPTMMDAQDPIKPFPIEFLTSEGLLSEQEINRPYQNLLKVASESLANQGMGNDVDVYEVPEDIKILVKDRLYFAQGSLKIIDVNTETYEKVVRLMRENRWHLFIQGYASEGEQGETGGEDSITLSLMRAKMVAQDLMNRGVDKKRMTIVGYGDSRLEEFEGKSLSQKELDDLNQKVDFIIKKGDLRSLSKKVDHQQQ